MSGGWSPLPGWFAAVYSINVRLVAAAVPAFYAAFSTSARSTDWMPLADRGITSR